MYSLKLTGIREAKLYMSELGKSGPFLTSHMINGMLPKTRKYLGQQAKTKLDQGATVFTRKSALRYDKALIKKGNVGRIYWTEDAFFMEEVIRGGQKKSRKNRLPEPNTKNFRLDRHGNIPQNFQQQVSIRQTVGVPRAKLRAKYKRTTGKNIIPRGSDRRFKNILLFKPRNKYGVKPGIYRKQRDGSLKILIGYYRRQRNQDKQWDAGKDAVTNFNRLAPAQFRKSYAYWNKRRRR